MTENSEPTEDGASEWEYNFGYNFNGRKMFLRYDDASDEEQERFVLRLFQRPKNLSIEQLKKYHEYNITEPCRRIGTVQPANQLPAEGQLNPATYLKWNVDMIQYYKEVQDSIQEDINLLHVWLDEVAHREKETWIKEDDPLFIECRNNAIKNHELELFEGSLNDQKNELLVYYFLFPESHFKNRAWLYDKDVMDMFTELWRQKDLLQEKINRLFVDFQEKMIQWQLENSNKQTKVKNRTEDRTVSTLPRGTSKLMLSSLGYNLEAPFVFIL